MNQDDLADIYEEAADRLEDGWSHYMCHAIEDQPISQEQAAKALRIMARHLGEELVPRVPAQNLPKSHANDWVLARACFLRDLATFFRNPIEYRKQRRIEWTKMDTQPKRRSRKSSAGRMRMGVASSSS